MERVCDSATSRLGELVGIVRRCLTSAGSAEMEKPAIAPGRCGQSMAPGIVEDKRYIPARTAELVMGAR